MKAFHDGDFERALELERRAQVLEPSPVYLYQIGRALEALGLLHEAYQTYLTARANLDGHPHTVDDLRALVASAIEALSGLQERAVLRVTGFTPGVLVQVDGRFVDPDDDLPLQPGGHAVCFIEQSARSATCLTRELARGRRTMLAMPDDPALLARLVVAERPRFTRARLDGQLLLVEPQSLDSIHLEPGRHEVELDRDGGAKDRVDVELVAGDRRPLDPLPDLRRAAALTRPARLAPWLVCGLGAALMVTSGVLFGVANEERTSVEQARRNELDQVTGLSQRSAFERWRGAERASDWGWGVGASGLAAVVGGVVWLLVDGSGESDAPVGSEP